MPVRLAHRNWNDLSVLLVNDDGIDAEGLSVLEEIALSTFGRVVIVAPAHEHSGQARAISNRKDIRVDRRGHDRYAIHGTPTDCVIFGLGHLFAGKKPDLVLSGVNHGDNAGQAITYSGTFGAAFEAGLSNIPAIALSQVRGENRSLDFSIARRHIGSVFRSLQESVDSEHWPDHVVMNVNFPAEDRPDSVIRWVPIQRHAIFTGVEVDPYATDSMVIRYNFAGIRDGDLDHDVSVLARGDITVTPVLTNWTCYDTLQKVR